MSCRPHRILATRHENTRDGIAMTRVELDQAPVAVVPQLDAIVGGWWLRSGGYPIRDFGTRLG